MSRRWAFDPLAHERSRRSTLRIVAALVALAIAAVAALLAQDVRAWRDVLHEDAARYTLSPRAEEQWSPATLLPASASGRLLAVARDRRELSALRFFAIAHSISTGAGGLSQKQERILTTSQQALSRVTQDPDPQTASQAYNLLGILLFVEYRAAYPQDSASLLAAVAVMQNAVRADGDNEEAKANLELLLRQRQADFVRQQQSHGVSNQGQHRGDIAGRGKGVPPVNAREGDY